MTATPAPAPALAPTPTLHPYRSTEWWARRRILDVPECDRAFAARWGPPPIWEWRRDDPVPFMPLLPPIGKHTADGATHVVRCVLTRPEDLKWESEIVEPQQREDGKEGGARDGGGGDRRPLLRLYTINVFPQNVVSRCFLRHVQQGYDDRPEPFELRNRDVDHLQRLRVFGQKDRRFAADKLSVQTPACVATLLNFAGPKAIQPGGICPAPYHNYAAWNLFRTPCGLPPFRVSQFDTKNMTATACIHPGLVLPVARINEEFPGQAFLSLTFPALRVFMQVGDTMVKALVFPRGGRVVLFDYKTTEALQRAWTCLLLWLTPYIAEIHLSEQAAKQREPLQEAFQQRLSELQSFMQQLYGSDEDGAGTADMVPMDET